MIILAIVLFLASLSIYEVCAEDVVNSSCVTPTNWMKYLPNTASIGAINIPGTHDSGCTNFVTMGTITSIIEDGAKTQNLTLNEQMEVGVRVFDLRISKHNSLPGFNHKLTINHGGVSALADDYTIMTTDDVLKYCSKFLSKHKTEILILRFAPEPPASEGYTDIDRNGEFGELERKLYEDIKKGGNIVLNRGDKLPTVGEARGKIVAFDKSILSGAADNIPYEDVDGKSKWEGNFIGYGDEWDKNGVKHYLDIAKKQPFNKEFVSPCENQGMQILGTDCYKKLGKLPKDRRASDVAPYINDKIKNYNFKKGYYYGWISTDYIDKDIARVIYSSNLFDFDANGGTIRYISDISMAYDQDINKATNILIEKGYTVLEKNVRMNFNPEGGDKIFSHAWVNGKRNKGTFNIAVGYKTSTNPFEAITDLKWFFIEKGYASPSQEILNELNKYGYSQISTESTIGDITDIAEKSKVHLTKYDTANFNIGTMGRVVNLVYTKNQAAGERLVELKSLNMFNKSSDEESEELFEEQTEEARELLEGGYYTPRNEKNQIFACNYGRDDQDDVYLFYRHAFSKEIKDKKQSVYDNAVLWKTNDDLDDYMEDIETFNGCLDDEIESTHEKIEKEINMNKKQQEQEKQQQEQQQEEQQEREQKQQEQEQKEQQEQEPAKVEEIGLIDSFICNIFNVA